MIHAIFLAVPRHTELKLGIGKLRSTADLAAMERFSIIEFVLIELPFPRHRFYHARLPTQRRNARPEQVVRKPKQQKSKVNGIRKYPDDEKRTEQDC